MKPRGRSQFGSSLSREDMEASLWKWLVLALVQLTWAADDEKRRSEMEKEILQNIFMSNKFHMYVRPDKGNQTTDDPLDVSVSLYILHIDIDSKNEVCNLLMYFRQEWNDSRLSFNDQGRIQVLSIHDAVGFWSPDLFFVNEVSGHFHSLTKPNIFVRIFPQGRVLYSQRLSVKFTCPMDFTKYPFDSQTCRLPIESYGYTANDLMLKWKPEITLGMYEPSGFHVAYSTSEEIIDVGENQYSRLELGIHLTRLVFTQIIHVYLPLAFLVASSWISFWLRPSSHVARLTTAILTTVATLMFLQSTRNFFYPQCYLTAMDVWVGFSVILVFAALFQNVYVVASPKDLDLSAKDGITNQKEVPELPNAEKEQKKLATLIPAKLSIRHSNADLIARITFPSVFVVFNLIYFTYFLI